MGTDLFVRQSAVSWLDPAPRSTRAALAAPEKPNAAMSVSVLSCLFMVHPPLGYYLKITHQFVVMPRAPCAARCRSAPATPSRTATRRREPGQRPWSRAAGPGRETAGWRRHRLVRYR